MLREAVALAWDAGERLVDEDGLEMSGHVAFTAMLALFPFLVFLAALAGLVGDVHGAETFVEYLFLFVPQEIVRTLVPAINQVLSTPRTDLAAIGLVAALWSAMSGVDALRVSLNRAYGAIEHRPYWRRKVMDFAFVLLGSIMIVLLTIGIVLGPLVAQVLTRMLGMFAPELDLWARGRYVVTLAVMLAGLVVVHRWLPNVKHRARDVLPGAIATTVLWVLAAMLFGEYLGRFANYGATYGSLAGVIAALLFFYVSAILFVYGGQLNAALYRRRKARANSAAGDRHATGNAVDLEV
jgi:membrane protein